MPPTLMQVLRLSKQAAHQIIDHARDDAPNECCGILAGIDDSVSQVYRATNVDRSPVQYTIDPQDMIRIMGEADRAGQAVLGFYHSHTFSEAYPSVTDVKRVPPSDLFDYLYVIVSLAQRDRPVIRAFRIADSQIDEVPVEIGG
ncbi:MAG: M67 family metallopeptidase [Dehalococcoidia bacterium]